MQQKLLPVEVLNNSAAAYLPKVSVKSKAIYNLIIGSLLLVIALLPVIKIDVSVIAGGEVHSEIGRSEIKTLTSGILSTVHIKDNQFVKKGQELFVISAQPIETKLQVNSFLQKEKQSNFEDLMLLVKNGLKATPVTSLYKQQLLSLKTQINSKEVIKKAALTELERDEELYKNKVIARAELEQKKLAFDKIQNEINDIIQIQLTNWQNELAGLRATMGDLQAQEIQYVDEKKMYTITAPVDGTIQLIAGKTSGSFIQMGEQMAILSPDSNLLVECLINPRDIGFVRKGMPVKFQIDAFNYNEWGSIDGQVIDIANDFAMINNNPVYKVK